LEVDFDEVEISFERGRMLELYYREAATLDRRNRQIAAEAMRWLKEDDRSIADTLLRAWNDRAARTQH
jgi:hypothetical protein